MRCLALKEKQDQINALAKENPAFTVDLLGEATITEMEAERYQEEYFNLIDGLTQQVNTWPPIDLIDRDHRGPAGDALSHPAAAAAGVLTGDRARHAAC